MSTLDLPGYEHVYSGKVRDLYAPVGADGQVVPDRLLLVASNRLSAYDWMMSPEIPDKGEVLTRLSLWWFDQLADLVPNHVVSTDVPDAVAGRAVLVRRLEMLKVEAIARAYLTGGGLEEYRETGAVCGVVLPVGLESTGRSCPSRSSRRRPRRPWASTTCRCRPTEVEAELGADVAAEVSRLTRAILARGNEIAAERGILIADTKVEFGVVARRLGRARARRRGADAGLVALLAGRAWQPGHTQPSYDKQFVRDWLTSAESGWTARRGEAPPELPERVVEQTRAKYVEAYELLTGERF